MGASKVLIRSEQVADYAAIAQVHARAFDYAIGMGEVALVDALRRQPGFDPALSLVAEVEQDVVPSGAVSPEHGERELSGDIVGHVMFTRVQLRLGGTDVSAAILAPIGVVPEWQGHSIGTMLIEEGHRRASNLGIDMVMLLGHPEYYPRFGYQTDMFGSCGIQVKRENLSPVAQGGQFTARRVRIDDIPWLVGLWHQWFGSVDLAIQPSCALADWLSPDKGTTAAVICRNDVPLGYLRSSAAHPEQIHCLLANDAEAFTQILSWQAGRMSEAAQTIHVPVHPSVAMNLLTGVIWTPVEKRWAAAMVCPLNPQNRAVMEYCAEVRDGRRPSGLVIWPTAFDVC